MSVGLSTGPPHVEPGGRRHARAQTPEILPDRPRRLRLRPVLSQSKAKRATRLRNRMRGTANRSCPHGDGVLLDDEPGGHALAVDYFCGPTSAIKAAPNRTDAYEAPACWITSASPSSTDRV